MTDTPTTLCISASGGDYACALRTPDHRLLTDPGDGREHLASIVARLFDRAALPPASLRELRLDIGPGSYTGLRVAVTFARTLQVLGNVTVLTATSLELLALRAWKRGQVDRTASVRPVLDARRGRLHHAPVQLVDDRVALGDAPAAVPLHALLEATADGEVLLVEQSVLPDVAAGLKGKRACTIEPLDADRVLAEELLDPVLAPRVTQPEGLEPLYLMGSYAD